MINGSFRLCLWFLSFPYPFRTVSSITFRTDSLRLFCSDPEFSEQLPAEQNSHLRRLVTRNSAVQFLQPQLLMSSSVFSVKGSQINVVLTKGYQSEEQCFPVDTVHQRHVNLSRLLLQWRKWNTEFWLVESLDCLIWLVHTCCLTLSLMMDSTQYLRSFSLTPLMTACIRGCITLGSVWKCWY